MQPLRCTGHKSFQSVHSGTTCRPQPRTLLFEDAQVEAMHEPHNPLHDSIKGGVFSSSGALTFVRSNLTVTWANKTKSDLSLGMESLMFRGSISLLAIHSYAGFSEHR